MGEEVKKILILRYEHMGDYIVSLPAIKKVRDSFPLAEISIVVAPWNEKLAGATPYVDKILVGKNPLAKRNLSLGGFIKNFIREIPGFLKFIKLIRGDSYDLVISFSNRKFSKFILPFVKSKKIISGLDLEPVEEREVKRCLRVVESLGAKQQSSKVQFKISKQDKEKVNKILRGREFFKKDIVILHLLTPLASKNWPKENWIKLIKKIDSNNRVFVLIGTAEERAILERIKSELVGLNVVNLAGKLDLVPLVYFISKVKFYLGGDSGPMHIANLFKIPSVILFGQTNEKVWGPEEDYGKILKRENIRDITVGEVLKAIK